MTQILLFWQNFSGKIAENGTRHDLGTESYILRESFDKRKIIWKEEKIFEKSLFAV